MQNREKEKNINRNDSHRVLIGQEAAPAAAGEDYAAREV